MTQRIRSTPAAPGFCLAVLLALAATAGAGAGEARGGGTGILPAAARPPTMQEVRGWDWVQDQAWTDSAARPQASAAQQVAYAYEFEKRKEWDAAAVQYFLAVKAWPASKEAPLALQRLARVLYAMSDHYRAFRAIDQIFDSYPASANAAGQPEVLLAVELRIANRLLDLAEQPPRAAEYTARGVYIPRPAEYVEQAENILDTMLIRLDDLLVRAEKAGQVDEDTKEKRLALGRAIARGKARVKEQAAG